jgi:hypothetical protein
MKVKVEKGLSKKFSPFLKGGNIMKKLIIIIIIIIMLINIVNVPIYASEPKIKNIHVFPSDYYINYVDLHTVSVLYHVYGIPKSELNQRVNIVVLVTLEGGGYGESEVYRHTAEDKGSYIECLLDLTIEMSEPGEYTVSIRFELDGEIKALEERIYIRGEGTDNDGDGYDDETGKKLPGHRDYLYDNVRWSQDENFNSIFKTFDISLIPSNVADNIKKGNPYYGLFKMYDYTLKLVVAPEINYRFVAEDYLKLYSSDGYGQLRNNNLKDTITMEFKYIQSENKWVISEGPNIITDTSSVSMSYNNKYYPINVTDNDIYFCNKNVYKDRYFNSFKYEYAPWLKLESLGGLFQIRHTSPRDGYADNVWLFSISMLYECYGLTRQEIIDNTNIRIVNESHHLGKNYVLEVYKHTLEEKEGYFLGDINWEMELEKGINDITITIEYRGEKVAERKFQLIRLEGFLDEDGDGLDDRTGFPDDGSHEKPPDYDNPPIGGGGDYNLVTMGFDFIKKILSIFPPEIMAIFTIAVTTIIALGVKRLII